MVEILLCPDLVRLYFFWTQIGTGGGVVLAIGQLFIQASLAWGFNPQGYLNWLPRQEEHSVEYLLRNVSPAGTRPGVVVASPSQIEPNYFFHWIRDAALVMDSLITLYERTQDPLLKRRLRNELKNFVKLTRMNQERSGFEGLGEPKYEVNGDPFTGPWGRPQNDGPALRALTLMRLARILISEGEADFVSDHLYDLHKKSAIKLDLEYVAQFWPDPCFDLWEEMKGDHLYTRMVQHRALMEGATFARERGDRGAQSWYLQQAAQLASVIEHHKSPQRGTLQENMNYKEGVNYKFSGLDSASILAVLHGKHASAVIQMEDPWVLRTVVAIEKSFRNIYSVNHRNLDLGVAIGRYPEDRYFGGNPWFLNTHYFAEFYFSLAVRFDQLGRIEISDENREFFDRAGFGTQTGEFRFIKDSPEFLKIRQGLLEKGEGFLARSRFHSGYNGQMDEQMDRDTGFMKSAQHLTWSYASFLTANWARGAALTSRK